MTQRQIKFRAWDEKRKRMYFVSDLHIATVMNGGVWATVNGKDIIEDKDIKLQIQPKDIKLMQFTGLTDKNGKEIYEGDIVKNYDEDFCGFGKCESIGSVYFGEGSFCIEPIKIGSVKRTDFEYIYSLDFYGYEGREFSWDKLEIIGNIYENPSLVSFKG